MRVYNCRCVCIHITSSLRPLLLIVDLCVCVALVVVVSLLFGAQYRPDWHTQAMAAMLDGLYTLGVFYIFPSFVCCWFFSPYCRCCCRFFFSHSFWLAICCCCCRPVFLSLRPSQRARWRGKWSVGEATVVCGSRMSGGQRVKKYRAERKE